MKTKVEKIKLIILDVDGTMTDGRIHMDNNGVEGKSFNVKDGFAIVQAIESGIDVAIITGKSSEVVKFRAKDLKIKEVHQGVSNKVAKCEEIVERLGLTFENIAYMGDDINDMGLIKRAGFTGAPADAVMEVREIVNFISCYEGGKGAVRDFVEYIMKTKGLWNKVVEKYS